MYRAGDWVEVKSAAEILASVDANGEVEYMPFMPEMLRFCGQRLRVAAVAHKTCDTANRTGGRRVPNALHLEGSRCDGTAHGGCQAGCLLFWKTDWVRRVAAESPVGNGHVNGGSAAVNIKVLREAAARTDGGETIYSCQATRLFAASQALPWWNVGQYVRDLRYGNVRLARFTRVLFLQFLFHLRDIGLGYRLAVAIYDSAHRLLTGRASPHLPGLIRDGQPTPTGSLGLSEGEWVAVKPLEEIRTTITEHNFNRGMRFDKEMAQFCEGRFKVERRVERLIDERTGKMLTMKSPCIVLEGAVCSSDYSERRLFCPRQIPSYFREIWLRRAE